MTYGALQLTIVLWPQIAMPSSLGRPDALSGGILPGSYRVVVPNRFGRGSRNHMPFELPTKAPTCLELWLREPWNKQPLTTTWHNGRAGPSMTFCLLLGAALLRFCVRRKLRARGITHDLARLSSHDGPGREAAANVARCFSRGLCERDTGQ